MDRKWNLQDIRPAAGGERKRRPVARPVETHAEEPEVTPVREERRAVPPRPTRERTTSRTPKKRKPWMIGIAVAAVIIIPGIVIGYLADGATLTAYPRTREPNVNATVRAYNEPRAGELSYDVMTLEAEGERQVRASGEEEAEIQATGEIEITNTRSTSERLIKNTRFRSPEGLIFRITESVVVPAASGDGKPGSVRARVFADEAGEKHNIGPSTFNVPGYEEGGYTDLYNAITAKSSAPMQGGFVGTTYVIDDAELAAAQESLHAELAEALRVRVQEERPAGFVMFDESIAFSYESMPTVQAGNEMVTIREKALLHAPIFSEGEFAAYIAAATIPGYEQEPVRMESYDVLTFGYTGSSSASTDLRTSESLEFSLMGKPLVVWTFDHEMLKKDLANTSKAALRTILGSYPAIERAEAAVRPFWKRTFPTDPGDIKIVETLVRTEE